MGVPPLLLQYFLIKSEIVLSESRLQVCVLVSWGFSLQEVITGLHKQRVC